MTDLGRLIIGLSADSLLAKEKPLLTHAMTAGILLFKHNYIDNEIDKLQDFVTRIKSIAHASGKNNFAVFVDQEGGHIVRFGRGFSALPAMDVFGVTYDIHATTALELAEHYGYVMANELRKVGIISLAPVVDLKSGNIVIEGLNRALHNDPIICGKLAEAFIDGMHAAAMPATLKHFPGHGRDIGDSHLHSISSTASLEDLLENDLIPFIELFSKNKADAVMPAHIKFTAIDPNNTVVNSKIWIQDLLRNRFGFKGLVISDCLSMQGAGNEHAIDKLTKALQYCDLAILRESGTVADTLQLLDKLQQSMIPKSSSQQNINKRYQDFLTLSKSRQVSTII